jgi:CBS domain-containing protein
MLRAMDVGTFLARYAPFSELDEARLGEVVRAVEIAHFPAGEVILRKDGPPSQALYVVRKGAIELLDGGVALDLLGEGEVFGQFSLLAHDPPSVTARAHEDTLCYLVTAPIAQELLTSGAGPSFVAGTMRQRVRAALERSFQDTGDPRYRRVGSLLRRPLVTIEPDRTIAEAAARMADERVSSLLVPSPDGWSIITDRDLRVRVVAPGLAGDRPVRDVATAPVHTVESAALAGDALTSMLAYGVHHLPVVDGGEVVGVVTDTDLMGLGRHTPFAIKSAVTRGRSRAEIAAAARDLPEVVATLVEGSADPVDVGRVVSLVFDAAADRLVELAVAELGEPPGPFAWLAMGSGARHEQSLTSDQDHALAFDAEPEHDAYFAELAASVTEGLEEAGLPRCRGNAMAVHPTMRAPIDTWAARFRSWISRPDAAGQTLSSIALDYRRQAGALDAERALDAEVRGARARVGFARLLGEQALANRPPTGFFGDLVVASEGSRAGRLDIKHGGITIVTNLARTCSVRAGSTATGTLDRLDAAAAEGLVTQDLADDLGDAFRFLWQVRLRHHAEQVRGEHEVDDLVDPAALGAFARSGLKEAFRTIRGAQRVLAADLGLRLG